MFRHRSFWEEFFLARINPPVCVRRDNFFQREGFLLVSTLPSYKARLQKVLNVTFNGSFPELIFLSPSPHKLGLPFLPPFFTSFITGSSVNWLVAGKLVSV